MSEQEVAPDRYTSFCCWLLYRWIYCQKGEESGHTEVHEQMELEYYHARSQYHHLAVVWLICILSCLCRCGRGERCKCQHRGTSSRGVDTVDGYLCLVSKFNYSDNVNKFLNSSLSTHTISMQLVVRTRHTSIYFFQEGVLPLSKDFSHPPSHVCKVSNHSLILNIPSISKRIRRLVSARCGDRFQSSQDPPTPIV